MKSSNGRSALDSEVSRAVKATDGMRFAAPVRYGLAILSVALALGAGLLLQAFHFRVPAATLLLFAVATASWYAGRGTAVLAVILATISCYWFFVEPVWTIYINYSDIPYFLIFTGFAVLLCWFGTVRRRIEAELRASEERFRTLVQFSFDVYWESDAQHRFTRQEFSESAVDAPARGSEIGKARWEIPYLEPDEAAWQQHRATMDAHLPFRDFELARPTPDGGKRYVSVSGLPVFDEAGRFLGYRGVGRHITERKRAEENLRRLNRELRAISDCNQALLRATDEPTLLKDICRIVCEEAGYRMAWVGYAEQDEAKSVRPVAWAGAEEGYLTSVGVTWADTDRGRGPTGSAIRSRQSCCIQDFATDPRLAPWRESVVQRGFRSGIALPLKDEHANAFGSLTIHSAQPNAFTPEEIRLLEELAGDLAFGIVTLRSAAARKQAEEALRQSEAYLAEAQRLSHTGSWAFDVASNKYVYASEECLRIFELGAQEDSRTREAVARLIHPEDWPRVNEAYEKSFREKIDTASEFRIVLASGTVKHVHAIRHPVLDGAGEVVQLVGTVMDVTERKHAEEERRESAERFRAIADYTYDWESWIGSDGRLLWVNPAVERITGYAVDECMAMPGFPVPIVAEADRDTVARQIGEAIQGSSRNDFEFRVRHKDGHLAWVAASWQPIYDSQGARLGHRSSIRDIAERKQAEDALRRTGAYLAEAERLAHTGSWAWNPLTEQCFYWSEEMFHIFALDPRQGLPTSEAFWQRIHPEDRESMRALLREAARGKSEYEHDHRIVLPDGTVKHVRAIGHPVLDENGEVAEYVGTAVDITERKHAERERDRVRQLEADLAHTNRVSMMGELAASIAHEVGQPLAGVVNNGGACLRWLAREVPNLEEAREAAKRIVRDGKRAGQIIARIRAMTKKAATANEKLALNETIQDVLALVGDEAKKKSVIIRDEFASDLSLVSGDRVQLQQVVLNLILNGIDAMSSVEGRPRELAIITRNLDPDQVQVTVEDAGTGLDPSTIDKIFDPFYTTKSGGMGMGLSISRSIVQAHGGRLWATAKDGPGTLFHFTLPKCQEDDSNA